MKMQPLKRSSDGTYPGAVGGQSLSAENQKAIRRVLADAHEPLMIGTIAAEAGVSLNTPQAQNAASDFIANYLVETRETEMFFEDESRKNGRKIFRGYVGTSHLRDLIEKGLA